MKVLLDENVPETLTPVFARPDTYETWQVNALGWQGKQNGELLHAAQQADLVTTDVNLYNQQKAHVDSLAIIVLRVFSDAPAGILPLVQEVQDLLADLMPGDLHYLYIDPKLRASDQRRRRGEFAP
jgi:predicted nuclease of predicted toxin-antitoxin system